MLNCKKSEWPLLKNSLKKKFCNLVKKKLKKGKKKEICNQVILKLRNGRAKEIRDRLKILRPEQLEKEKIYTQITDFQIIYNNIGKYGDAPDFSLDKKYLVIKKNLLKAYKKYIKKLFGKYHPS